MKLKWSIRNEIKVAVALIAVSFLIAFAERRQSGSVCKDIIIELENVYDNHFMDEAEILRLVESSGQSIKGTSIDRINLKDIETKLKLDKHIRRAELFGDLKGNLIVSVTLRKPLARIVREDGPDAYVAEDGTVMPVSEKFTARVMLISGPHADVLIKSENLHDTDAGKELMDMITFIYEDAFWKAQVAQLDMNSAGKITIYPQMTGQRVEFGVPESIDEKFRKLMIFYKEILPQRGWTRYERVNLEYEGQIIAE